MRLEKAGFGHVLLFWRWLIGLSMMCRWSLRSVGKVTIGLAGVRGQPMDKCALFITVGD
jgi:hypothetical protein